MLFRKKIPSSCSYCVHATKVDDETIRCAKKGIHEVEGSARTDYALTEAENVCVVVLTRKSCREHVGAASGTNALVLVCRHRHADTGSADQNTELAFARENFFASGMCIDRIVTAVL